MSAEFPIALSNHLNTLVFTNVWPATNTLKAVAIYQPYVQTNISASVQILKWQLELAGVPSLAEQ